MLLQYAVTLLLHVVTRSLYVSTLLPRCYAPATLLRSSYAATPRLRCYAPATLLHYFYFATLLLRWSAATLLLRCYAPSTLLCYCYVRELDDGFRSSCYVGLRERRETPKLTPRAQQGKSKKEPITCREQPALLAMHLGIRRRLPSPTTCYRCHFDFS